MGSKKKVIGICRLCGEEKELNKEHVPPRSCYNKHTTYYSIPIEESLNFKDLTKYKPIGKKEQGGVTFCSLCGDCNSFLGSQYVNSYKNWVNRGFFVLKEGDHFVYGYKLKNIEPLKILKQIISMFLSINSDWYLKSYPELSEFVLNSNSQDLPDKFKVYSYLNNEGVFRHIPHMTKRFQNGVILNCTEITYPPYGYVLTIDNKSKMKLTDITFFKDYSLGDKVDISLEMVKLPTFNHNILEYPPKENS